MYRLPWQKGRVFQTPVGVLASSFVLRPNTMFHPEGEWSVRLILTPLLAHRLRQLVAPAYDDVLKRAKEMYLNLPLEQQAGRPFKANPFWQAAAIDGGQETENISFGFRLPAIDRAVSAVTACETTPAVQRDDTATATATSREVVTQMQLLDRDGEEMTGLTLEPDGWEASVHFTIQQYWLRTFGAGVTLRLVAVQLFTQRQRPGDLPDDTDVLLPIAL
jgi:hypothetical protein